MGTAHSVLQPWLRLSQLGGGWRVINNPISPVRVSLIFFFFFLLHWVFTVVQTSLGMTSRFSCLEAHEILDQGSNLHPLHWKADS